MTGIGGDTAPPNDPFRITHIKASFHQIIHRELILTLIPIPLSSLLWEISFIDDKPVPNRSSWPSSVVCNFATNSASLEPAIQ